jgi:hypothetical protein
MNRWVGIILVAVLYFVFNKQLENNLIGEKKSAAPKKSSAQKFSFPQVDHKAMSAARPSAAAVKKITEKSDPKAQCFYDMFNEVRCDFDCWVDAMDRQGSSLPELALRNWKKQDSRFNLKNHTDVYALYHALNSVGLLTGGDEMAAPEFDKAIDILTELSLKDSKNYYPYLFLAMIHEMKGESVEVVKTLNLMDENARYYNNYYSSWMAQLESQSTESFDLFARAVSTSSQIPIPSLAGFIKLQQNYKFDKKKLVGAMVESVELFKKEHKYSISSVSMIDFIMAAHISNDPKLKARRKEMLNLGVDTLVAKFSADFPSECERSAVEAWFQKHRSEIQ